MRESKQRMVLEQIDELLADGRDSGQAPLEPMHFWLEGYVPKPQGPAEAALRRLSRYKKD